jgi:hypothetical protein
LGGTMSTLSVMLQPMEQPFPENHLPKKDNTHKVQTFPFLLLAQLSLLSVKGNGVRYVDRHNTFRQEIAFA